ncbi:MAG: DUF3426 domain-containing protein [Pseudomonadota bacterium]
MITYCPSCHTYFRVHVEQLAVRAGQVRCGKCGRVFNAIEHLIDETMPAYAPRPADEVAVVSDGSGAMESSEPSAITEAAGVGAEAGARALAETAGAEPRTQGFAIAADAESSRPAAAEPVSVPDAVSPSASSFDFGPVATADPGRRARRWPWLLGALLMLAILLAQSAYFYRSAVTLLFPETKPYAMALCAKLGCEVPLPRRIDLMSIEASDLQADTSNTNVMVLTATIKNRAIFSQQHPFLELTLTDGQDQPLARRVLAPQDYIGKGFNAQAGVAANSEMAIKVIIDSSQVKATGYRLYLFYP